MLAGLAATTAGSVVAATAGGFTLVVVAQVLLGTGAGLYFPAGLQAVPAVAGAGRRGFAMGIYGVAFSLGLTIAAVLGAIGAVSSWRVAFWSAAALAAAAFVATWALRLGPPSGDPVSLRFPAKAVFGLPTVIGAVGAVCQYGAIPFLTTFAVDEWHLRAGQAAALLAVGRIISIVAKLLSGASSDRRGPVVSARTTGLVVGLTGIAWVLLPAGWPAYASAAVFAGAVSSFFPVANMVAVDYFGASGPALGAYRSAQIGIGAAAGWLIGRVGEAVGLRSTLLVAVASPTRARRRAVPPAGARPRSPTDGRLGDATVPQTPIGCSARCCARVRATRRQPRLRGERCSRWSGQQRPAWPGNALNGQRRRVRAGRWRRTRTSIRTSSSPRSSAVSSGVVVDDVLLGHERREVVEQRRPRCP